MNPSPDDNGGTFGGMPTRKTSMSLTSEAIEAATEAAELAGMSMSAWLSQAAIEHAWRQRALAAAQELVEESVRVNGPLSEDDERWVAEAMADTRARAAAARA